MVPFFFVNLTQNFMLIPNMKSFQWLFVYFKRYGWLKLGRVVFGQYFWLNRTKFCLYAYLDIYRLKYVSSYIICNCSLFNLKKNMILWNSLFLWYTIYSIHFLFCITIMFQRTNIRFVGSLSIFWVLKAFKNLTT